MELKGATASHVGNVRESNQDRVHFGGYTGVVADGMGGHQGGEMAASIAISEFVHVKGPIGPGGLAELVESANRAVFEKAADPDLRGMGTTLVALTLRPAEENISIVNVGDSRAYQLRGDTFKQLTLDHSLVEDLVRQERLTPEEAQNHPQRNILTRALGIASQVEVDRFIIAAELGDRFLLCSDGLFNEVSEENIIAILSANPEPNDAADRLIEAALGAAGRDNISVAVIDVVPDGEGGDLSSNEADTLLVPTSPSNGAPDPTGGDGLEAAAAAGAVGVDLAEPALDGDGDGEVTVEAEAYGDENHVDSVEAGEPTAEQPLLTDHATDGDDHDDAPPVTADEAGAGALGFDRAADTDEVEPVAGERRSHLGRNLAVVVVLAAILAAVGFFVLGIGTEGRFLVETNASGQLAFFQEPRFPWGDNVEIDTSSAVADEVDATALTQLETQRFDSLDEARDALAAIIEPEEDIGEIVDGVTTADDEEPATSSISSDDPPSTTTTRPPPSTSANDPSPPTTEEASADRGEAPGSGQEGSTKTGS